MDKAYIVANKQQEREVLDILEREGYLWRGTDMRPTKKRRLFDEPITFFARDDKRLTFDYGVNEAYLADHEIDIVFDGRKESKMREKYVVSQEFMNKLKEWKDDIRHEWFDKKADGKWLNSADISDLESITEDWWLDTEISCKENNNRLIAIIRWVNGEDVFEVEKPKKWVVRSKSLSNSENYWYVLVRGHNMTDWALNENGATKFATKEEAQSWANSHQEVVEVEK